MKFATRRGACAVAVFALWATTPLSAGEITGFSWFSGVASVASTKIFPASAPNNDDVAGVSPNGVFVTQKDYKAVGPVDLEFRVDPSGGVTEYSFVEGVFNGTPLDWSGYHIELGFGHGLGFTKSLSGDGLDFDAPDHNSPLVFDPGPGFFFPTASATEDDIFAGGGVMPKTGFAGYFKFSVDVPDGITSFTIRQSPIAVPEPSAFALAGIALGAILCARNVRSSRRGSQTGEGCS